MHSSILRRIWLNSIAQYLIFSALKQFSQFTKDILSYIIGKKPSIFKLLQLYSAQNKKDMCNIGKFIHLAFKIRDAYVQQLYSPLPLLYNIYIFCCVCNIYFMY
jgi:hypothetical protein